jgi:hypothetical protein
MTDGVPSIANVINMCSQFSIKSRQSKEEEISFMVTITNG